MPTWATNLRAARAAAGLSQRALAAKAGAQPVEVHLIERGYIGTPNLRAKLARALDVVEAELFADVPEVRTYATA